MLLLSAPISVGELKNKKLVSLVSPGIIFVKLFCFHFYLVLAQLFSSFNLTEEEYVKRSKSDMRPLAPMKSAALSQMAENQLASSVIGMV